MRDIQTLIEAWREEMSCVDSLREGDIVELEVHLRESTAELARLGLTSQEAFLVARTRLGDGKSLGTEFRKINGSELWCRRVYWMVVGYALLGVVTTIIGMLARVGTAAVAAAGASRAVLITASVTMTVLGCLALMHVLYRTAGRERIQAYLRSARVVMMGVALAIVLTSVARSALLFALHNSSQRDTLFEASVVSGVSQVATNGLLPLVLIAVAAVVRRRSSIVAEAEPT